MASESKTELAGVNPLDYLAFARELAARPDAAALRSAGDRAYYATFLFTRNELLRRGYVADLSQIASHGAVNRALARFVGSSELERQTHRELGERLRQARDAMTYETDPLATQSRLESHGIPTDNTLAWMLTAASRIIAAVDTLPALR